MRHLFKEQKREKKVYRFDFKWPFVWQSVSNCKKNIIEWYLGIGKLCDKYLHEQYKNNYFIHLNI